MAAAIRVTASHDSVCLSHFGAQTHERQMRRMRPELPGAGMPDRCSGFPLRRLWKARLPAIRSGDAPCASRSCSRSPAMTAIAGDAMEAAVFEKQTERPEDLGLSIADGKALMAAVQQRVVNAQVTSWTEQHRCCEACGARRHSKGSHPVVFLTLYGDVQIASPRLHRCPCQSTDGPATVSPLRNLTPRLRRSGAALPGGALGIARAVCRRGRTPRRHPADHGRRQRHHAARARPACGRARRSRTRRGTALLYRRLPGRLGQATHPEGRIAVGLDGGYVRDWEDRKTNFEVIVGRSVPEDRDARYLGLVHGYDSKPKRRLFDVLKSQGLQANQDVTFLTDGGEEIRALTELVTPGVGARPRLVPHHDARDSAGTVRARRRSPRRGRRRSPAGGAGTEQVAALAWQPASCPRGDRDPGRRCGWTGGRLSRTCASSPSRCTNSPSISGRTPEA